MKFVETSIPDVLIIEPEFHTDDRGFFARTFCQEQFAARRLVTTWAQCSVSFNHARGTVRGLHFQAPPHGEVKLVRCTRGAIHDVVLDLREHSPTFLRHVAVTLNGENRRLLYIPEGLAHGFQTLEDETEVFYQISTPHRPQASRGVRWNDPAFSIRWPLPVSRMSERDRTYPDFHAANFEAAR